MYAELGVFFYQKAVIVRKGRVCFGKIWHSDGVYGGSILLWVMRCGRFGILGQAAPMRRLVSL
jgi:hypothetical protein